MMNITSYSSAQLAELLHRFNVRPSVQRLAVLSQIVKNRTHPTADEIYSAIAKDFPSLSRATVYNSLHTLVNNGVLRELEIENSSTRYDFALQPTHGHFICKHCKKIYDMPMPHDLIKVIPNEFSVEKLDIYIKGICPDCA